MNERIVLRRTDVPTLRTLLAALLCCGIASSLHADIVISIPSNFVLQPGTSSQVVPVTIQSTDPTNDPLFDGMPSFHVEIGDGLAGASEPVFQGVPSATSTTGFDFSNGIFAGNTPGPSGPVLGAPSIIDANILGSTTIDNNSLSTPQTLVELIVDTSSFPATASTQIFDLRMGSHFTNLGGDSTLALGAGTPFTPTINNGSIQINAIPEPSAFLFLAVSAVAIAGFSYARRRLVPGALA